MFLILNGIFKGINWINFTCPVSDELDAYELVSSYIADGLEVKQVALIDQNCRTELPVDVFDGQPISGDVQQLQNQWEHILAYQSIPTKTLDRQRFINWNRRLLIYYDRQINLSIKAILRLHKKMTALFLKKAIAKKQQLLFYKDALKSYKKQVSSLETARQKVVERLKVMEN
ncbi:hypothetical protein GCM10027299_58490 [Larkinella ripae]